MYPDGSSLQQSYDENGNTISYTNEKNETEQYAYDALDHLTSSTNGENETTTFTYDNLGNELTKTFPSGNIINYV